MNVCYSVEYKGLPENIKNEIISANVYYSEEYCDFSRARKGSVVYFYNDRFIQAVKISAIKYIFRQAVFVSEPHLIQNGSSQAFYDQQKFFDEIIKILKFTFKIDWITSTPTTSVFTAYPSDSTRIKFGNFIMDLAMSEDELFSKMQSKHRNMVRRGIRGGGMR